MSVVTVTLNSAQCVGNAIQSVLAQTTAPLEYIVIDGGSRDGTLETVEGYRSALGSRLRMISERDQGLYDAMNKGIAMARGDVIGLLNGDDAYLPHTIDLVSDAFAASDADVVFGDIVMQYPSGPRVLRATLEGVEKEMRLFHPSMFVRASVYERWGGFDTGFRIAADYDFILRAYRGGAHFVHVDHPLTVFAPGGASSRPFRLAREVYAVHRRHFSLEHALRSGARRVTQAAFLIARQRVGRALLGERRYAHLAARVRSRSARA